MAGIGLGPEWTCTFANDFDEVKASAYKAYHGGRALAVKDVRQVTADDLPGRADLAWASFPCQDLSLAGSGAGLSGERSGMFWPFWHLMRQLRQEGRAPRVIVLENVYGVLKSNGGRDFATIAGAVSAAKLQARRSCDRRRSLRAAISKKSLRRRLPKGNPGRCRTFAASAVARLASACAERGGFSLPGVCAAKMGLVEFASAAG